MTETILTRHPSVPHPAQKDPMTAMQMSTDLRLHLARVHRQADLVAAANARLVRRTAAPSGPSLRVRIGRTVVRLGERLAAEPPFEVARPR